jgi:hypothetical protein
MILQLLYTAGFEKCAVARAQGTILLTHHTPLDEPDASITWIVSAMENLMEVEAQLVPRMQKDVSLHRRLKWAIVIRDRILSLGRRRSQVLFVDISTLGWLEECDFKDEMTASLVYSKEAKRFLFKVLQAQCRLAVLLTDVVALSFPSFASVLPLSVQEFYDLTCKIKSVSKALANWKVETQFGVAIADAQRQKSINVFVNMTLMYYE